MRLSFAKPKPEPLSFHAMRPAPRRIPLLRRAWATITRNLVPGLPPPPPVGVDMTPERDTLTVVDADASPDWLSDTPPPKRRQRSRQRRRDSFEADRPAPIADGAPLHISDPKLRDPDEVAEEKRKRDDARYRPSPGFLVRSTRIDAEPPPALDPAAPPDPRYARILKPGGPVVETAVVTVVREIERVVPDVEREARLEARAASAEQKLMLDRLARLPPAARADYLARIKPSEVRPDA